MEKVQSIPLTAAEKSMSPSPELNNVDGEEVEEEENDNENVGGKETEMENKEYVE